MEANKVWRWQFFGCPVRVGPLPDGCAVVECVDDDGEPMLSVRCDGEPMGEAWVEAQVDLCPGCGKPAHASESDERGYHEECQPERSPSHCDPLNDPSSLLQGEAQAVGRALGLREVQP